MRSFYATHFINIWDMIITLEGKEDNVKTFLKKNSLWMRKNGVTLVDEPDVFDEDIIAKLNRENDEYRERQSRLDKRTKVYKDLQLLIEENEEDIKSCQSKDNQ